MEQTPVLIVMTLLAYRVPSTVQLFDLYYFKFSSCNIQCHSPPNYYKEQLEVVVSETTKVSPNWGGSCRVYLVPCQDQVSGLQTGPFSCVFSSGKKGGVYLGHFYGYSSHFSFTGHYYHNLVDIRSLGRGRTSTYEFGADTFIQTITHSGADIINSVCLLKSYSLKV